MSKTSGDEITGFCDMLSGILRSMDFEDNQDLIPAFQRLRDVLNSKLKGWPVAGPIIDLER